MLKFVEKQCLTYILYKIYWANYVNVVTVTLFLIGKENWCVDKTCQDLIVIYNIVMIHLSIIKITALVNV